LLLSLEMADLLQNKQCNQEFQVATALHCSGYIVLGAPLHTNEAVVLW